MKGGCCSFLAHSFIRSFTRLRASSISTTRCLARDCSECDHRRDVVVEVAGRDLPHGPQAAVYAVVVRRLLPDRPTKPNPTHSIKGAVLTRSLCLGLPSCPTAAAPTLRSIVTGSQSRIRCRSPSGTPMYVDRAVLQSIMLRRLDA